MRAEDGKLRLTDVADVADRQKSCDRRKCEDHVDRKNSQKARTRRVRTGLMRSIQ